MKHLPLLVLLSAVATKNFYFPVTERCNLTSVVASVNADPGDSMTMTVKKGATTIGTFTFGTDVAVGDTAVYTADSDNGDTVFDEGDVITLETPNCDTAADMAVILNLDPYCRPS